VTSLNKFKRLVGSRQQKVGKKAERIILFADAMEKRQEKILAVPAISPFPNYVMFDLEGMPPQCDELDRIYLWGMQVYGDKPNGQPRYRRQSAVPPFCLWETEKQNPVLCAENQWHDCPAIRHVPLCAT